MLKTTREVVIVKQEDIYIEELNLSVRSYNVLKRAGIYTISQITEQSIGSLSKMKNMTIRCLEEILSAIIELSKDDDEVDIKKIAQK